MLDSRLNPEPEQTWFTCEKCGTGCPMSAISEDMPKCMQGDLICSYCFGAKELSEFDSCYECREENCAYRVCPFGANCSDCANAECEHNEHKGEKWPV